MRHRGQHVHDTCHLEHNQLQVPAFAVESSVLRAQRCDAREHGLQDIRAGHTSGAALAHVCTWTAYGHARLAARAISQPVETRRHYAPAITHLEDA